MQTSGYVILMVEDNENVLTANRMTFEREGNIVYTASNLAQARKLISMKSLQLAILDIMLPDGSGLDLIPEIRAKDDNTKILMLTSKRQYEDILQGLTEGADDYMTKPYRITELKARAMAMLLKSAKPAPAQPAPQNTDIVKGTLVLKTEAIQALLAGEDLGLTTKEFQVLKLLIQNEGECVQSERIFKEAWNITLLLKESQAVRSALSRLRKKITGSGYTIESVRNQGYKFKPE